jgi:hypothetical protein
MMRTHALEGEVLAVVIQSCRFLVDKRYSSNIIYVLAHCLLKIITTNLGTVSRGTSADTSTGPEVGTRIFEVTLTDCEV